MTLLDIQTLYSTDERCREILTKLRWPNGVECPRCKATNVSWIKARKQFECAECQYQFSVTAGTIFNDSHLPLNTWFTAVLLLVEARKGFSANQMKRTIGVSYKTAWYLCHRIRKAMAGADTEMLTGTVEMDETWVGGREQGKGKKIRKEIVIGLRQRGGDLRFFHASDVKSGTLAKYIKENVSADFDVMMTDEYPAYPKAMIAAGVHGTKHKTVKHKAGIYAMGDVYTNTVESAFSLLKRGVMGTWHKISAKHLAAYLSEMEFRFNRRKRSDLFLDTLRHMVTADPLTFERLTA
jgi:transposase-like protein